MATPYDYYDYDLYYDYERPYERDRYYGYHDYDRYGHYDRYDRCPRDGMDGRLEDMVEAIYRNTELLPRMNRTLNEVHTTVRAIYRRLDGDHHEASEE